MAIYAVTVFLSAFLLFQVQPMIAKMILPWFGGASSVWNLCLVFFQSGLLVGYAYVHWVHERLRPAWQPLVHAALLLISLLTLPVAADPAWKGTALAHPEWAALAVLATAVGIPYVLLSTTGPLMQAWYARASHGRGIVAQPYRLYALSNLASMLGLLTYPVLVEPRWEVEDQTQLWSWGYGAFVLSAAAAAAMTRRYAGLVAQPVAFGETHPSGAPRWSERLLWIGLAATPSILLVSITRLLTQDVAPVPFLWVVPLAIYLISFILCFDAPRYYVRPLFLAALPVAFLILDLALDGGMNVKALVVLLSLALFVFCMVCHGELVRRKPPVRHLTLFFLMLSVGGAIGGAFVGLLAPAVFSGYHELPIGLFLCAGGVVLVLWRDTSRLTRVLLLVALGLYAGRLGTVAFDTVDGYRQALRNFYGQTRVLDTHYDVAGPVRVMRHGRINHGEQYLAPQHLKEPTAYYCRDSGIGRAMRSLPTDRPRRLGVVGLGTGTLAAYGLPGDEMRIYEINDQVLALAESEFTFLRDSAARIVPVLGDGRLMLEREAPQGFDLLAMDAFSGDSIPAHLLTLEAIGGYLGHLAPEGWLAIHITNTYLDLRPVMAAAATHHGRVAVLYAIDPPDEDVYCRRSWWVLLLRPEQVDHLPPPLKGSTVITAPAGFRPWTDGFSNLLSILK